jgi:hypothetical protein
MSREREEALRRFPVQVPQTYRWEYLYLINGRLVDKQTQSEANKNWPSFNSVKEAEQYLTQHDIRATVLLEYKEYTPRPAWEMTREEYYEPVTLPEHWKSKGFKSNTQKIKGARGYRVTITTPDGETLYQHDPVGLIWMRAKYKDDHRDKVKDALAKGLPVPARVLADYPDLQGAALPATLWASPVRKEIDNLERMWKNSPEAFYRNLKYYKGALKERKEGKGAQKFPRFSISDLEQIVKEADKLYR